MSLVYRAIWRDDAEGIHQRSLDAFEWWTGKHSTGERQFTPDVTEQIDGTTTLVRFGQGPPGSIQRCSLHVDNGTDRTTTTLITTATPDGEASVWVDLERVSHLAFAAYRVQAPALSTRLIAHGVHPRRGPIALSTEPRYLKPDTIDAFVALLASGDRDLPIVVFTPGPHLDAAGLRDAALHAARVLAGTAAVYLIGEGGRARLGTLLGPDLAIEPGGVRVYLPRLSPDEPDPWRHRALAPEQVLDSPRGVAHLLLGVLSPATAARRAPAEYQTLRDLLLTGSNAAPEVGRHRLDRLHDLEEQLEASEQRIVDLLVDREDAEARINDLQSKLVRVLVQGPPATTTTDATTLGLPTDVESCRDAVRTAAARLGGISVPPEACQELDEIDARLEGRTWGRMAWRAFLALHAFALDTEFKPGFWEWCVAARTPLAWPASPKKLAMDESESILADPVLRGHRILPVDRRVDPSGRVLMVSHIKIGGGGGSQLPRIYFLDDRHGPTGKVHVGFFGPHHLMPTSTYH